MPRLADRQVELVAHEAIHKAVGEGPWNAAVAAVVDGMKRGKPGDGFVRGIEICGDALAAAFPLRRPGEEQAAQHHSGDVGRLPLTRPVSRGEAARRMRGKGATLHARRFEMGQTHQGGCHCGAVRFEVTADIAEVTDCNCSICAKKGSCT